MKIFAKNVIQILIHSFIKILARKENKNQKKLILILVLCPSQKKHFHVWFHSLLFPSGQCDVLHRFSFKRFGYKQCEVKHTNYNVNSFCLNLLYFQPRNQLWLSSESGWLYSSSRTGWEGEWSQEWKSDKPGGYDIRHQGSSKHRNSCQKKYWNQQS